MHFKQRHFLFFGLALFATSCNTCTDSCLKTIAPNVCEMDKTIPLDPNKAQAAMNWVNNVSDPRLKEQPQSPKLAGTLLQVPANTDNQGYTYVKVDDNFIKVISDILKPLPPGLAADANVVGAHISVLMPDQLVQIHPDYSQLIEVGETFTFTPCCLSSWVTPSNGWVVLQVQNPELMCLLKKYLRNRTQQRRKRIERTSANSFTHVY